jgi:hypothetical protein
MARRYARAAARSIGDPDQAIAGLSIARTCDVGERAR